MKSIHCWKCIILTQRKLVSRLLSMMQLFLDAVERFVIKIFYFIIRQKHAYETLNYLSPEINFKIY